MIGRSMALTAVMPMPPRNARRNIRKSCMAIAFTPSGTRSESLPPDVTSQECGRGEDRHEQIGERAALLEAVAKGLQLARAFGRGAVVQRVSGHVVSGAVRNLPSRSELLREIARATQHHGHV